MARTRSRVDQGPRVPGIFQSTSSSGSVSTFSDWATPGNQGTSQCVDTLSTSRPYTVPHDFTMSRWTAVAPEFSGSWKPNASTTYMLTRYSNRFLLDVSNAPALASITGIPSLSELALKAIANMNPNTPVVDFPVFLGELKDLPHMVKQIGDLIRSRGKKRPSAADAHLAYAFGWRPLISDLMKMISLTEATEKRQKYLQRLAKGTRIKRKLGSGSGDLIGPSTLTWAGATGSAVTGYYTSSDWTAWYTAWAKYNGTIPSMDALHAAAFRAVVGMTGPSLSQAWELLPWSWLMDYFTNFGAYLQATRGGLPFTWSNLCIMRRTVAERRDYVVFNPQKLDFQPGLRTSEFKERKVFNYTPLPAFRQQVLSWSQLAILGSLAASRSNQLGRELRK